MDMQSKRALSEVQKDLGFNLYFIFLVVLQILHEVLAFWEFFDGFSGFCKTHSIYVWGMLHEFQIPDTEFWILTGSRKARRGAKLIQNPAPPCNTKP